ncbi:DUF2939 domain-containing protein [Brevundimonas sp. SGAir0440]|uniref:DUF2939 domain-containing protein n=1 Tax=Brevundimonas sp. SGAir0440 TaxID=2579977 RepID=UPI0010CD6144|nr:DUF2939 domain-containing protein [Brevundimonas sp. SGAir0440]QCQ97512.1 DUF2939 domain-containing protein [Brevundimonas sp. SGAir0440]
MIGGNEDAFVKRLFGNLVLAAVVVAVLSFFAAPAVAFFAIRSAAEANDVAGLARLIDFNAVRQSLRPQLAGRPEAMAPAPSFLEDPIGAFRRQIEQNPILRQPDVDAYLTPAALSALLKGEGRYASQRTSAGIAPASERSRKPWPNPAYWSVNRARMAVTDQGGSRTLFTFERRGPFEWQLVHIGLPDGTAPAVTVTPR